MKRVYIEKANGKLRPLGIPTVKDRTIQAAVKLIIEPIFEADFHDCSYGFSPGRNAQQAVDGIAAAIKGGKTKVYDADLSSYFDTIPHDKLFLALQRRITGGSVLGLIRQWLKATIVEPDGVRKNPRGKGTPQGRRIEDALENRFGLTVNRDGWGRYFKCGYPSRQFAKVNNYVQKRLYKFVNRKSQRCYRLKYAETYYGEFKKLGLITLTRGRYCR